MHILCILQTCSQGGIPDITPAAEIMYKYAQQRKEGLKATHTQKKKKYIYIFRCYLRGIIGKTPDSNLEKFLDANLKGV